ncbi:MAG: dihydroxy-acid dehydratase, partial [SAR324 cluster bacterium]|nr:dihydroxy-acid dehydratase [SAR324 cluster bacterium]
VNCILVIRGCGPVGYPGSAEVVNMQPPDAWIKQGILELPTLGDGRQSGTSGSPSILNVSPESAVGGGLALLKTGDTIKIDLNQGSLDVMLDESELDQRRNAIESQQIEHQTPWQEIYRETVGQLSGGGIIELAAKYKKIRNTIPRHSH